MSEIIIYNFTTVIELLIMSYYYKYMLGKKQYPYKVYIVFVFYVIAFLIVAILGNGQNMWWQNILITVFENIIVALIYGGNKYHKATAILLYIILSMLSEVFSTCIFASFGGKWEKVWYDYTFSEYATLLFSKVIDLLLVIIAINIVKKSISVIRRNSAVYIVIVMVISMGTIISNYFLIVSRSKNENYDFLMIIPTLGILIINVAIIYVVSRMIDEAEQRQKEEILRKQFSEQEKRYAESMNLFKRINKLLHDTSKHLGYIRHCLEENHPDEALSYLNMTDSKIKQEYPKINTGVLMIDAMVNNTLKNANEKMIRMETKVEVCKERLDIDSYQLCIILGNTLENAVEACERIEDVNKRYIKLKINMTDYYMVIKVENSRNMDTNILSDKTGDNEMFHGYGIENVKNAVEECQGNVSYFAEKDIFIVTVSLPLEKI